MAKKKKEKKKEWIKPKLIILTRSKPEERVLSLCKIDNAGGPGPDAAYDGTCERTGPCDGCSARSPS